MLRHRLIASLLLVAVALPAWTDERSSDHYLPGSLASFIDGMPLSETFLMRRC